MEVINNGYAHLKKVLSGEIPSPSNRPYDEDAPFIDELKTLEYIDPSVFNLDMYDNHMQLRSRIRYLAALFPTASLNELTNRIFGLLNNKNITVEKLRLILAGKKLSDPSQDTHEVRIRIIQGVGRCLKEGMSIRATAREMGLSYDTVAAIEHYVGINKAFKQRQLDRAVNGVRDNVSVRLFAKQENISRTLARTLLTRGKSILIEIGEYV